jgi:hypothetical protein
MYSVCIAAAIVVESPQARRNDECGLGTESAVAAQNKKCLINDKENKKY